MKKLLALLAMAGVCQAGTLTYTTPETQGLLDWTTGVSTNYAATNAVAILDRAAWYGVANASTHSNEQTFVGGSFLSITNLEENVADTGFTVTTTNITVAATGRYNIMASASWDTATLSECEAHFYTNGVILLDYAGHETGWKRSQGAGGADGVAVCHKTVGLTANSKLSFKVKFDANETVTWHYVSISVEKK